MTENAASAGKQQPEVTVGKIECRTPSPDTLAQANLVEQADYLEVIIPVTVLFGQLKSGFDLILSAEFHAPCDHHPASIQGFSPATSYEKTGRTINVNADIKVVQIGVTKEVGREKMVSDAFGLGTSHLQWTILGRHRQLPGNQVFRLLVREQDISLNWIEVNAEVRAERGVRWRTPAPVSDRALSPVTAPGLPRAASTLTVLEGRDSNARLFFVGAPLNLPLAVTDKRLRIARSGNDRDVVGSFRWFDNVGGRSVYKWMQKSPTPVRLGENPSVEIHAGDSKLLKNRDLLTFSTSHAIRVLYQVMRPPPRATVGEALDIDAVVDDAKISTYRTEHTYVAIGRDGKHINIDRLDISAFHGYFEYSDDHWSYTQVSADSAATLHRQGRGDIAIPPDQSKRVEKGDIIRLRKNVWLVIR